jgi:Multiubiquitin
MTTEFIECDDVGEALREGRPLRPARAYRYRLATDDLNFRDAQVADLVPLGRQILAGAGLAPNSDISLIAILGSGDLEDVRLDEPFDLSGRGAERFIAFQSDREFKLILNGRQLLWGKPFISGAALRTLGGSDSDQDLFQKVPGGGDRPIGMQDLVDLAAPGVEQLFTATKTTPMWEITVNSRQEFVPSKEVPFEQVVKLAYPNPEPETNVVYSVTYRHVASTPHAGELAAGGSVEVKHHGSIFNVARTIQS